MKKIEQGSLAWEKHANSVARDFVTLRSCHDCGGPVVDGYICTRCGSTCPEGGCDDK